MSDALVARRGNHARVRQCQRWANGRGIGRSMDVTLRWRRGTIKPEKGHPKKDTGNASLLLSTPLCKDTPLACASNSHDRRGQIRLVKCNPTRRSVPRPLACGESGGTQTNADDRPTVRLMMRLGESLCATNSYAAMPGSGSTILLYSTEPKR